MIKKVFAAVIMSVLFLAAQNVSAAPDISYSTHMQDYGWKPPVGNDQIAGAIGKGKRLEALIINCAGIEYCAHVENYGWQHWVRNGEVAGTVGENLRMEALRIRLRGNLADRYDVYYRVYLHKGGWQDWVRNGEMAGTTGESLRIEAVQIRLVKKNGRSDYYSDSDDYDDYNRREHRRDRNRW